MIKYRHKQTGNVYRFLAYGIDCSNGRPDPAVMVYCPEDNEHSIRVMQAAQFEAEFEVVG